LMTIKRPVRVFKNNPTRLSESRVSIRRRPSDGK
jgi:hypothetical protein